MPLPLPERAETRLLEFLESPTSYPYNPRSVRILQTHTAYVAIAPPFVYKVKKPVDLGFLDFSTLAKRKQACEDEVRLNQRLCPNLYLGVVPLYRDESGLTFAETGEVAEYNVQMHPLAEGGFADERLARGELSEHEIERVVKRLGSFYRQTPTPEVAAWGRIDKLKVNTDENFAQTEHVVGTLVSRPAFETIRRYTNRFYEQHARLFNQRRAGGHILDAHGDLHLHHIHITDTDVFIYDCIEFSDRLRYTDVAADVAFLAMDLDYHGRPDLSRFFVARMAEVLNDPDLVTLSDFYKCYRAYVRAKVEGMRSEQREVPEAERRASQDRARRYYQLALRYALTGSDPAVIVLMGGVATGKTTQAEAVAAALGWEVLSSDVVRKTLEGVPLFERGSAAARANLYSKTVTDKVYAVLLDGTLARANQGQGTVIDATYGNLKHRATLRKTLQAHEIPHAFVELTATDDTVEARLRQREAKSAVISDARLEDVAVIRAHYDAPNALEDARHVLVQTDTNVVEETTLESLEQISLLHA